MVAKNSFLRSLFIRPGRVFIAGQTFSANFPGTAGGAQPAFGGGSGDVFVGRLSVSLTTLNQATFLGGSGGDAFKGVAIDPTSGDVFVAGQTTSTDFPGTVGGAQPANAGGSGDAFIARLTPDLAGIPTIAPSSGPASGGTVVTITGSGFQVGATVTIGNAPATGVSVVNSHQITATTPALAAAP